MRRVLRDRRGITGILFALTMPVTLGFAALGTEVGMWYLGRHRLQTAADVAAIAAAYELLAGSGAELAAAEQEAVRHGLDPAAGGTVAVNNPPLAGAAAGDEGAVEVVLTQDHPLLFAAMFLEDPVTISARATARLSSGGAACILALDPSAHRAIDVGGTADLRIAGCVLAANSFDAEAVAIRGSADVEALGLTTAGGYSVTGSASLVTATPPRTGAPPLADPYADRSVPGPGACDETGYQRNDDTPVTIAPGRYCDGMDFSGLAEVDFQPGTYIVDGGEFNVNAGAVLTCSACTGDAGVTVVLTGSGGDYATVRINGTAEITLRAPRTGPYAGLLFFQDPSAPAGGNNVFNGTADMTLEGALYFPSQSVAFSGTSDAGGGCTQIVARTVSLTGTTEIGSDCDDTAVETIHAGGTVRLVE